MKFEIYKDGDGWHWRLLDAFDRVVAVPPPDERHDLQWSAAQSADALITRIVARSMMNAEENDTPGAAVYGIEKRILPVDPMYLSDRARDRRKRAASDG